MGSPQPGQITELLRAWAAGEPAALDRLFPDVYNELKRIAESRLRARRQGDTIDPTTLVHEAYLRLGQSARCNGRTGRISSRSRPR